MDQKKINAWETYQDLSPRNQRKVRATIGEKRGYSSRGAVYALLKRAYGTLVEDEKTALMDAFGNVGVDKPFRPQEQIGNGNTR